MSLKTRLILGFILISIIPVTACIWFGYYNSSTIIRSNAEEAAKNQVKQTGVTLDVWIESYEDILFQIYTNDEIVALIDTINRNDADFTVSTGQLRRTLRGLFYAKEHIKSITVITETGTVVFYDLLTGFTTKNSWLDTLGIPKEELYHTISQDNLTHMISTRYAGVYANESHYLFHLGHRIIDYKDVDRKLGVVIVSIDEQLLQEICSSDELVKEFTFITDNEGYLVSYPNRELIGTKVAELNPAREIRNDQYLEFIKAHDIITREHFSLISTHQEKFDLDIVHISDQNRMMRMLENQRNIMLLISVVSTLFLILVIVTLTHKLTDSLQVLVGKMKQAEKGELSVRMDMENRMLPEVRTIGTQFNRMLDKIGDLMTREKHALEKQKNAEIEALEAQINPHFLYNTLDTINWIAIDKDEYEISNAITSLASILRYGIDKSNSIVTARKECEWLKQYLFLQQTRQKNQFHYEIHADHEILEYKVHKLLFQPFVENSILHGFEGKTGHREVRIIITEQGNMLRVEIFDNGKGICPDIVQKMNQGIFPESSERNHIGMKNAFNRIHMYYPDAASVQIESELGEYTRILLLIPKRVD